MFLSRLVVDARNKDREYLLFTTGVFFPPDCIFVCTELFYMVCGLTTLPIC